MVTVREFLGQHVLRREEVDHFLNAGAPNWAVFDSELGYVLKSSRVQDGLDDSHTYATYLPSGERRIVNHADRPCRINAYGDSYTQCQQVNDEETWEEYLAGHLGEPVRNFGVGGYGVYQAYLRMRRMEQGSLGAPYVILGIFGPDDHCRSLDAWRRPRCGNWFRERPAMFHANPWDFVLLDPNTGHLVEHRSLCPTPESLYRLCEPEFVYETFKDDLALNLYLGSQPECEFNQEAVGAAADLVGLPLDPTDSDRRPAQVYGVYVAYAMRASMAIVERAQEFLAGQGKKLMVLLTYDPQRLYNLCAGLPREDTPFVDFLDARGIPCADMWVAHEKDYAAFHLSPADYVRRYCIPHYNPFGNHFLAYAIKDRVVGWLEPKPVTYAHQGRAVDFDGYLEGA